MTVGELCRKIVDHYQTITFDVFNNGEMEKQVVFQPHKPIEQEKLGNLWNAEISVILPYRSSISITIERAESECLSISTVTAENITASLQI